MIENVDIQSRKIDNIIKPFLSDNLDRKLGIELCQVGKFISLLDKSTRLLERRESPDFIISYDDELIGLEHESIIDKKIASDFRSTSALFDDAAISFSKKFPKINILVNFYLSVDRLNYKKHEKPILISIIVDYISRYISNQDTPKPDFIDYVVTMDHTMVSFNYNPGGHIVNQLNKDILTAAITRKEQKIADYRRNTSICKQWLLMTIGTYNPDSFEFGNNPFYFDLISDFDRIYLMEDLRGNLWRLK